MLSGSRLKLYAVNLHNSVDNPTRSLPSTPIELPTDCSKELPSAVASVDIRMLADTVSPSIVMFSRVVTSTRANMHCSGFSPDDQTISYTHTDSMSGPPLPDINIPMNIGTTWCVLYSLMFAFDSRWTFTLYHIKRRILFRIRGIIRLYQASLLIEHCLRHLGSHRMRSHYLFLIFIPVYI